MTSPDWSGSRLGPYQVLEPIGAGGMGAVVRARHVELGVDRALKVILETDPIRRGRFLREARHTACVTHPNVVRLHEAGELHGVAWYAMDLVAGEDLESVLRRGPLLLDRALGVAIQAAEGVAALHAHGVVHRDLKPANVMLTSNGRALVIDLGLAIAPEEDERLTRTGAVIGSLAYMAPEQLLGEPATARSDVYALGLMLFELLTGVAARDDSAGLGSALGVRRASELRPDLPYAIEALLDRALAVQPADRFGDAAELALALRDLRARPGWSRRARRRAILGVCLGVCLGVGAAALAVTGPGAALLEDGEGGAASARETPTARASGATDAASPGKAPVRPALSPAEARDGEREWQALRRMKPGEQLTACDAWLKRYPEHTRVAEVQRLRRAARLRAPLTTIAGSIADVAARGTRLVTADHGGRIQLWDVRAEEPHELMNRDAAGRVEDVAFAGTSRLVVVTKAPNRVLVLEAEDGREVQSFPIEGEPDALAVSPDGSWVAVGLQRGGLLLLRFGPTGVAVWPLLPGDEGAMTSALTFSADGRDLYVGTSSQPGRFARSNSVGIYRYRVATRDLVAQQRGPLNVKALTCRTDGTAVYAGLAEGLLLRLDPHTLAEDAQLEGHGAEANLVQGFDRRVLAHRSSLRAVHALPDGRLLSMSSGEVGERLNELRLWGPDDRELHRWLDLPLEGRRFAVSPEGGWFAVRFESGVAELWALPD